MSDPAPHDRIAPGHPHAAGHHVSEHPVPAASPFNHAEVHELQQDDIAAARAVVALMLGIFGMGVFIYSVVAFWVVSYS